MTLSVREQQVALYRLGFDPGTIDGADGPKTRAALDAFDKAHRSEGSTMPLLATLAAFAAHLPRFVQAKNYTAAHRTQLDQVVIHTAEAPEIHMEAVNVAGWFAQQPADGATVDGKRFYGSSAHYVVDDCQVVQCVLECDRAWHAGLGAGDKSLGIEHAGYASQTPLQWDDLYSRAALARSAELVAKLCLRFCIPIHWLSVDELKAGGRGICGHVDCTNAFANGHGHQDPGPNFPRDAYVEAVIAAARRRT